MLKNTNKIQNKLILGIINPYIIIPNKEPRFYRKVLANAKNMADDIFKTGLNLIIIQRNQDYDKRTN